MFVHFFAFLLILCNVCLITIMLHAFHASCKWNPSFEMIFTRMLDSSVYMAINRDNKVTNTLKLV